MVLSSLMAVALKDLPTLLPGLNVGAQATATPIDSVAVEIHP